MNASIFLCALYFYSIRRCDAKVDDKDGTRLLRTMTFLRLVISQALYFSLMLPTLAHSESTLDQVAIVIGAGPAGLACALGLSNVCKKVLLVEKHANFDRRGCDIWSSEKWTKGS